MTFSIFNLQQVLCAGLALLLLAGNVVAQPADESRLPYRQGPIDYFGTETSDRVAQLQARISRGELKLEYQEGTGAGYLRSLLEALDVPVTSQMLVFAKNSVNARRISPDNPRALYFNHEVYVGYVPGAPALEISAIDPAKGAIFYTLRQDATAPVRLEREESCLLCHASANAMNVPGHLLRSFLTDVEGNPQRGISRVSHDTPFAQRWGGWFVTGDFGNASHQGNLATLVDLQEYERRPDAPGRSIDLSARLKGKPYLAPQSDVVALMVHDHQVQMHNLITRVNYEDRLERWSRAQEDLNGVDPPTRVTATEEQLVRYLLFVDEPALASPVLGSSNFESMFAKRGRRDRLGRSLQTFDLETRLFKYRCSYLIDSPAFAALPDRARHRIYRRLWDVLRPANPDPPYDRIPREERHTVIEIVRELKNDLPAEWRARGTVEAEKSSSD